MYIVSKFYFRLLKKNNQIRGDILIGTIKKKVINQEGKDKYEIYKVIFTIN